MKEKTCCFTGHRELPQEKVQQLEELTAAEIRRLITECGIGFFAVGGAVGYDMLAARVLFRLRETEFPNIKVVLVYPFDGFADRWHPVCKEEYEKHLPQYDEVECVCAHPGKGVFFQRDRRLVDRAVCCVAYCTRNSGGTAYTLRYAKKQGLVILNIGEKLR